MSKTIRRHGSDRDAVFDTFPLPWQLGEQHESAADVLDANGVRIFRVDLYREAHAIGYPSINDVLDCVLRQVGNDQAGYGRQGCLAYQVSTNPDGSSTT
jgi:hypothetical protein